MKEGERLQYACGHWLIAGPSGIQDDWAQGMVKRPCGECQRRVERAAPELFEALGRLVEKPAPFCDEGGRMVCPFCDSTEHLDDCDWLAAQNLWVGIRNAQARKEQNGH